MGRSLIYKGKGNLKAVGVDIHYTEDMLREYTKCSKDPIYFIETYCEIVSLDHGTVKFKMYPYQKRIITAIHENKLTIGKLFRQAGKSTTVAAYFAWYVLFNEKKTAVIAANKLAIAIEIFERCQFIIENLPLWLQQGVTSWNVKSLRLENGSRIIATSSSPSAIRGMAANILLCDEYAHLQMKLAQQFTASVFPTISSGKTSKLIIISTPNGYNHFHKLWHESEQGNNTFIRVEGNWWESRSKEWCEEQRQVLNDEVKFRQEIECSFEGSSYTLIDGVKLASLALSQPLFEKDGLNIYAEPDPTRRYVATVDVSRGRHIDSSAMTITDITEMPYRAVLTYKNSAISTLEFPHLIFNAVRQYNEAYILIEVNDLGEEVANILWTDFEYENMFFTTRTKGRDKLEHFKGHPGVTTTTKVKALGCSVIKELIEKDQYLITSYDIIQELGVFVKKKKTYGADDENINDDLCTTLWLFGWLAKQPEFEELTDINLRTILTARKEAMINEQMTPYVMSSRNIPDPLDESNNFKLPDEDDPYYLTTDQVELLG